MDTAATTYPAVMQAVFGWTRATPGDLVLVSTCSRWAQRPGDISRPRSKPEQRMHHEVKRSASVRCIHLGDTRLARTKTLRHFFLRELVRNAGGAKCNREYNLRVGKADGRIVDGPHQVTCGSWLAQCIAPQGAVFTTVEPVNRAGEAR